MSTASKYSCPQCHQHWHVPPYVAGRCPCCHNTEGIRLVSGAFFADKELPHVTVKETRLPEVFKPDALKNAELERASMLRQFEAKEGAVTEAIRLERERITNAIRKEISEWKTIQGFESERIVEELEIVLKNIVNPK